MWIKPHFDMLSKLDFNLVAIHRKPLPSYHKEHGYSNRPDRSEELLTKYFPNVKIVESTYPAHMDFRAELYNEGLALLQDYDIVFRLDPDMFWTKENWDKMIDYIRNTDFNAYRMDFHPDSVNYYMTGDFDHGLKDAWEHDVLAVNPNYPFKVIEDEGSIQVLGWPYGNDTFFKWDGFICHHFRGWNKPKSTPNPGWLTKPNIPQLLKEAGNNGEWFKCPEEIKSPIQDWLKVIQS